MSHVTTLSPAQESQRISGVYTVPIRIFEDTRGRFMETFRREWFPWLDWSQQQGNRSDSAAGVLRGLHFHHHQSDYWYAARGRIRVALADMRAASPTFLATEMFDLGEERGVLIPPGVAHGFLALTDCSLTYLVNQYYEGGRDEYGVAWNDPDLALAWDVDAPVLSPRDAANPRWRDIPAEHRPR